MSNIFGPNELVENVHNKDLCIGCGACVDLCPYFKNYKGKTCMLFPCTLAEGRCFAHCPKVEVDLEELSSKLWGRSYDESALGAYKKIVIARAGEAMVEGKFQAGGTVSALMILGLKTDMIDAAVLTDRDGLIPVPRLITQPEEVVKCSTSKYMAAPTISVLNKGAEEGYERMGVVGTPCQVTAVAQMRTNPLGKEDFKDPVALVVGLFCTWAVDTRALINFLSERVDISKIRWMDIPPPPAEIFIVETEDGKVEFPLDEIRPLVPASCNFCPDMTSEWADISVGVLEGRPEWNTLIIRTEKGQELVDKASQEGYLVLEAMPEENLEHLIWAAGNKKKRALSKAKDEGMVNASENGKRPIFRIDAQVLEKITAE
jgi:coenzyme F420 hydrogenase subunit beta